MDVSMLSMLSTEQSTELAVNVSDISTLLMPSSTPDPNLDACLDQDSVAIAFFRFITNGIFLNVVGVLGILGNIISMIILSRPQMRSSINYLLIGLARCDTVLIITSILLFGLPGIYPYTGSMFTYYYNVYPHIVPVIYPLGMIAQTCSVYLTITVTLERFVAVCRPLKARSLCTYGRARIYVIGIIVFSILYNLPRFMEVDVMHAWVDKETLIYCVKPTPLRENKMYVNVYIHWLYLIFIYLVPFVTLAVMNAAIYRQVRLANAERQRLSRNQRREIGLATMLLAVVIVFFICNLLALVNNIMEAFGEEGLVDQVVKISNLLVTINSSVNFIIYVIFGEKFKRILLRLFCSNGLFGINGRDSPDGVTAHDDSFMSNGERPSIRLYRQSTHTTSLTRNGASVRVNGSQINGMEERRSGRLRAPSPGPCVYYPANRTCQEIIQTNNDNALLESKL